VEAVEVKPNSKVKPKTNEMGETIAESTEGFKPLIAAKFTSEETTPLTITIPGEKTFKITVERP
jgi:hypothetical protein